MDVTNQIDKHNNTDTKPGNPNAGKVMNAIIDSIMGKKPPGRGDPKLDKIKNAFTQSLSGPVVKRK